MPIQLPNRTPSSSTTKVTVLIHRHDRTSTNEDVNYRSIPAGEVDISTFVTGINSNTHLATGGAASITLTPTVDWQFELCTDDVINIYINTGRSQESHEYPQEDTTWKYNIGTVRLFFGFIDVITRTVSVETDGTKNTYYTIAATSFDKAVRHTNVYNNPHLSKQGDSSSDSIRDDISNNLGGLILLQKGYRIEGSPRQLIISHLLRTLGFGGQWVLPSGYKDALIGNDFYATVVKHQATDNGGVVVVEPTEDYKSAVVTNTSFKVYPADTDPQSNRTLENDFKSAFNLVYSEAKDTVALNPTLNLTTRPNAEPELAQTVFNILSLDYLEEVDGHYVLSQMYNFSGDLYSQLVRQSNPMVSELFFDLRPASSFLHNSSEFAFDGLGVALNGAAPMVPAVVLRERPFTNYKPPTQPLLEPEYGPNMVSVGTSGIPSNGDQLYVRLLTVREPQLFEVDKQPQVEAALEKLGFEGVVSPTFKPTNSKPGKRAAKVVSAAVNSNGSKTVSNFNSSETAGLPNLGALTPDSLALNTSYPIPAQLLASQPYSLTFSLPRPVFRSPDKCRYTREINISSQDSILGVTGVGETTKFYALGVTKGTANSVANITQADIIGEGEAVASISGESLEDKYNKKIKNRNFRYHILDYMTIYNTDITSETYHRGDIQVHNILEVLMDITPSFENQRAIISDKVPILTPISVQRHGVRVLSENTAFAQHLLSGGPPDGSWLSALAYRWCILLDMWAQHNHELISGTIITRGLPGVRVGYRIDRPEIGMSFYVEGVDHSWSYPGQYMTSISVSRGQPIVTRPQDALDYYKPEPRVKSGEQKRQELGRVFSGYRSSNSASYTPPGTSINTPEKIKS